MTTTRNLFAAAALLAAAPLAHASPATNVARNAYTNPDDNNDPSKSISIIFHANCRNDIRRNDTSTHEIGHRFGLLNASNHFSHIDRSSNWPAHNNLDKCIMSYDRTRTDTIVEFCRNCLLDGSALGATDSLRTKEDK